MLKHILAMRGIHLGKGSTESGWRAADFSDNHCPKQLLTTEPDQLDRLGNRGNRAGTRAISQAWTQDCSWLMRSCKKMKWMKWDFCCPPAVKNLSFIPASLQRAVSTTTTRINTLHSTESEETDCVFYIRAAWSLKEFKLMNSVSQMSNFKFEDFNRAILLLLFTFQQAHFCFYS